MAFLKCIIGLILGGVIGVPIAFVLTFLIIILHSLVSGNQTADENGGNIMFTIWVGCTLVGGIWGGITGYIQSMERLKAMRMQEAECRAREEANQRALTVHLNSLASESARMAQNLPAIVHSAENALDLAEAEFEEGVLDPFWDAVEQATTKLATFESHVRQIVRNAETHRAESGKLPLTTPTFQLGVHTLPDASRTANRMRNIVRRAQKNPDFSKIFHLRKTNQLLIAGFTTLGQAINDLGGRLDSSLETLSTTFSIEISDLADQAARESEARRDHERQEREMLDNIQRRKRPKR